MASLISCTCLFPLASKTCATLALHVVVARTYSFVTVLSPQHPYATRLAARLNAAAFRCAKNLLNVPFVN